MSTLRFELTNAAAAATAPRAGKLTVSRPGSQEEGGAETKIELETPTYFKYTRHGLQPHLVNEVARELDNMPKCTRVQLEEFFEDNECSFSQPVQDLRKFIDLPSDEVMLLDVQDPTVSKRTAKAGNGYMVVESEGGTRRLTPETFAKLVSRLHPDIVIPLADYVEEPLPSLTQGKRISKSVGRSTKWLDEYLAKAAKDGPAVFAPVMGSRSAELRKIAAEKLSCAKDIAGYAFNDVCLDVPFAEKLQLAQGSMQLLDQSKPRYMLGASAPDAAVRAILGGVDLVDSSYPYAVTEQGYASTYTFLAADASDGAAVAGARLDLWQESMFNDFGPLVKGCTCFTCRNHHRSYVHHLLMTKEMLSTVLLQIHNMHWYQRFFEDVRGSLARGTLAADAQGFLDRYCPSNGSVAGGQAEQAFDELDTLAKQECSPTTKIQRKRHAEDTIQ
ncbi:hypothetical protein GGI07_002102 [Coemansia sp. Benny D115]|nr:hypothetical protein GGI07_002102 [Coemansia sp. Benny D115]